MKAILEAGETSSVEFILLNYLRTISTKLDCKSAHSCKYIHTLRQATETVSQNKPFIF